MEEKEIKKLESYVGKNYSIFYSKYSRWNTHQSFPLQLARQYSFDSSDENGMENNNKMLLIFYYTYDQSKQQKNDYQENYLNPVIEEEIEKDSSSLAYLYNLIEFEYKYRISGISTLKKLAKIFKSFCSMEKKLKSFFLFIFYSAILNYMTGDISKAKTGICTLDDEYNLKLKKKKNDEFFKFLEIRHLLLSYKMTEENCPFSSEEVIEHTNTIFEKFKDKNELTYQKLNLVLGKAYLVQNELKNSNFLANKVYQKLKKNLFTEKENEQLYDEFPDLILIALFTLCCCYSLEEDYGNLEKIVRKISKNLQLIKGDQDEKRKKIYTRYAFQFLVYNFLLQNNTRERDEIINTTFNISKSSIPESYYINLFIMNSNSSIKFNEYLDTFKDCIKRKKKISQDKYLPLLFTFYNRMAFLSKIVGSNNEKLKEKKKIEEIVDLGHSLIDFFEQNDCDNLKKLIIHKYCQTLLYKAFYLVISSGIISGNLEQTEKELKIFDAFKEKYLKNIEHPQMSLFDKIKGDLSIKRKDFNEGIKFYKKALNTTEDINIKGLMYFSIATAYANLNESIKAKENYSIALSKFQLLNKKQATDIKNEKRFKLVEKTLEQLCEKN